MADELDPGLEAALAAALHSDADALPFTIRREDVQAAAAHRGSFPRRFAPLLGAAGLVLAIGGLTVVLLGPARPPGVGSADSLAILPSYERLLDAAFSTTEVARGEGFASAAVMVSLPGTLEAGRPGQVVFACTGPDLALAVIADGKRLRLAESPCTGGLASVPIPGAATRGATSAEIGVDARPGTAWRAIVVGGPMVTGVPAGAESISGLPSFDRLAEAGTTTAPAVARGSGTNPDADAVYRIVDLQRPSALEIVVVCSPGPVELAWSTGPGTDTELGAPQVACTDDPLVIGWHRDPTTAGVSELHVHAPAGTSWEALIRDISDSTSP